MPEMTKEQLDALAEKMIASLNDVDAAAAESLKESEAVEKEIEEK